MNGMGMQSTVVVNRSRVLYGDVEQNQNKIRYAAVVCMLAQIPALLYITSLCVPHAHTREKKGCLPTVFGLCVGLCDKRQGNTRARP